ALEPSSALLAMGLSPSEALCSVRFTFTRNSTLEEVDLTTERLRVVVNQLRSISV
ncbi:MAG TPA: cysteine desulfurase NifS, partial [Candidatus Avalokitesvara rifleensis]